MKYFCVEEMISSATALREGIDNRPPTSAYHLLHVLVEQLLDPIREAWGEPIVVAVRIKSVKTFAVTANLCIFAVQETTKH